LIDSVALLLSGIAPQRENTFASQKGKAKRTIDEISHPLIFFWRRFVAMLFNFNAPLFVDSLFSSSSFRSSNKHGEARNKTFCVGEKKEGWSKFINNTSKDKQQKKNNNTP